MAYLGGGLTRMPEMRERKEPTGMGLCSNSTESVNWAPRPELSGTYSVALVLPES